MIWELRHEFKVSLLIDVAGIPRSTYYYYEKHRMDEDKYKEIKEEIANIFAENKGRYGYRRITDELHNRKYVIKVEFSLGNSFSGSFLCAFFFLSLAFFLSFFVLLITFSSFPILNSTFFPY